jgi:hypothetical protein
MAEDRSREPGTPEWWVRRLDERLMIRRKAVRKNHAYVEGEHPLKFATAKFREAFAGLFTELADNFCSLVVEAVEERLNVEGFRVGDDPEGDTAAWDIWQRNALDAESELLHTESLISGDASAIVWSDPDEPGRPKITVESPYQVIVEHAPGDRRRRAAAWKVYRDDFSGRLFGMLYLPDGLYKWQSTTKVDDDRIVLQQTIRWEPREMDGEWPMPNPLKVVPVVPFPNRPKLLRPPSSEIASVIPIQDAINKLVTDLLVSSEYQSFRQRWATGMEIPEDPETHRPVEPFNSAVSRLWVSEDPETKFGEFGQIDLEPYVKSIEMFVQHAATQTRTPPHYFYLKGNLPSGESIKSAETGLVAKATRKMRHLGESWEEVMRLAFLVAEDTDRAKGMTAGETIWRDPEYRSEGEHVDATLKMKTLGIPAEALWEELGFTPTQIARFKALKAQEALELASAAATIGGRPRTTAPAPAAPVPPEAGAEQNGQASTVAG